jgi:hypothetical protein
LRKSWRRCRDCATIAAENDTSLTRSYPRRHKAVCAYPTSPPHHSQNWTPFRIRDATARWKKIPESLRYKWPSTNSDPGEKGRIKPLYFQECISKSYTDFLTPPFWPSSTLYLERQIHWGHWYSDLVAVAPTRRHGQAEAHVTDTWFWRITISTPSCDCEALKFIKSAFWIAPEIWYFTTRTCLFNQQQSQFHISQIPNGQSYYIAKIYQLLLKKSAIVLSIHAVSSLLVPLPAAWPQIVSNMTGFPRLRWLDSSSASCSLLICHLRQRRLCTQTCPSTEN